MVYNPTVWVNREVERPRTYTLINNADGTVTLQPAEGTIIAPGTPLVAENMNKIEQGIADVETWITDSKIVEIGESAAGRWYRWENGLQIITNSQTLTIPTLSPGGVTDAVSVPFSAEMSSYLPFFIDVAATVFLTNSSYVSQCHTLYPGQQYASIFGRDRRWYFSCKYDVGTHNCDQLRFYAIAIGLWK